jgi:hypothetical protein
MAQSRGEALLSILQEYFNPREDGWLWHAVYDDGAEYGVVNQIEGAYEDAIPTARGLAEIINECSAELSFLALCRCDGRPTEEDRELWRELRRLASNQKLTDMVVFNGRDSWSMRAEDNAAARAAG